MMNEETIRALESYKELCKRIKRLELERGVYNARYEVYGRKETFEKILRIDEQLKELYLVGITLGDELIKRIRKEKD